MNKYMRCRFFLGAMLGYLPVFFGHSAVAAEGAGSRPNFLVILTDDQTNKAIGYQNPQIHSPHLDTLAAQGTRMDRMYVVSAICMSSRASMMTGMYPQQTGVMALNGNGWRDNVLANPDQYPLLAQLMTDAGYRTALFGKSHLGDPKSYGFSEGFERKDINDEHNRDSVIEFLRQQTGEKRPFFLWFSMYNPHRGWRAPQEFQDIYKDTEVALNPNFLEQPPMESLYNQGAAGEIVFLDSSPGNKGDPAGPPRSAEVIQQITKKYWADVSCLDDRVGSVIDCLKETGLYDNTIIIFLSDNGYYTGQHGLGNKVCLLEEGVRVPAFVTSPLLPNVGVISESLVSPIDLYPTVLDYAGVDIPAQLPGKSWRPILENPEAVVHDYVIGDSIGIPETRLGVGHRMVVEGHYKYILTSSDEEAFFDLDADPYEMKNLISNPEYAKDVDRLRSHLHEWSERVGENRIHVEKKSPTPVGVTKDGYFARSFPEQYGSAEKGKKRNRSDEE